jgi:hypothetical protein
MRPLFGAVAAATLASAAGTAHAAASDGCAEFRSINSDVAALAADYERQSNEAQSDPRLVWSAASAYRCAAQDQATDAQRCIQVGQAKALYDKFGDIVAPSQAKALKRELTDAKRAAETLRSTHAEPCATLALQTAKAGQAGTAAQLFESVYTLTPRPLLLYNAARACELGGLPNEAAVYYMAYLALPIPWRDRRDAVGKLVLIQRTLATDTGDLIKRAEKDASNAYQWSQQASAAAGNAQKQAAAAQQLATSADQRARAAEQHATQAESRAQAAESRATSAESRSQSAVDRATAAEQAWRQLSTRLAAAEAQIRELQNQLARQPQPRQP